MSFISWISGYDSDNAARGNAAEAESRRINDDKAAWGAVDEVLYGGTSDYGAAWNAQVTKDYQTQLNTDPSTIDDAFEEGWSEGRQNVSRFISATINRILADPLRAVIGGLPWWLWALGLAALTFYLWPLIRRVTR